MPPDGLVSILVAEPAGLSIGKVTLKGGEEVLGVLAEPFLTEVRGMDTCRALQYLGEVTLFYQGHLFALSLFGF